ncbi:MAG: hypothetical protein ACOC7T_00770 [Planctomycetota bacterium]
MLSSVWTIAKNAFIEVIRQPVYAVLLVLGMVLIAFSPSVTMFSMVEDEKLMVDMALGTMLMLGLVMSVFGASQVISREIEQKTAGAVLSKPIGRILFVTGKFLGVTLAMALTLYLLSITLLITLRIGVPSSASWELDWPAALGLLCPGLLAAGLGLYANFFYRWNFTSTALLLAVPLYTVGFALLLLVNQNWQLDPLPHVFLMRNAIQVAIAALLVALGVWVLSSVAVAASTRLNVVMSAIVCLAVFFVGMVSQFLFGRFAQFSLSFTTLGGIVFAVGALFFFFGPLNGWVKALVGGPAVAAIAAACFFLPPARGVAASFAGVYAWIARRVVPDLEVFWVADRLMHKVPYIPPFYVAAAAGYAVAFCLAMLALSAYLFERREVV